MTMIKCENCGKVIETAPGKNIKFCGRCGAEIILPAAVNQSKKTKAAYYKSAFFVMKKRICIFAAVVAAMLIIIFLQYEIDYNSAMELYEAGEYDKAIVLFESENGIKTAQG